MGAEEFQSSVGSLVEVINQAIVEFFDDKEFDQDTMVEFGSQDIAQLATDAHMFGAGLYAEC